MRTLALGTFLLAIFLLIVNFFVGKQHPPESERPHVIEVPAMQQNSTAVTDVIERATQATKTEIQNTPPSAIPGGAAAIKTRQYDIDRYEANLHAQAQKAQQEQNEKLKQETKTVELAKATSPSPDNSSLVTIVRISFSILLLCASLYVILFSKVDPTQKHWAYGTIGTIVGFWFSG
jgi:hypothetical protein